MHSFLVLGVGILQAVASVASFIECGRTNSSSKLITGIIQAAIAICLILHGLNGAL